MLRQAVAIFEDITKKEFIRHDYLNIENYDNQGNKLKKLSSTLLSQERDNIKIIDTILAVFALCKDLNLESEREGSDVMETHSQLQM